MTLAPHAAALRAGRRMGDLPLADTMITDGLWDAFHDYHMGSTAETVATRWQVSREEQDAFALRSQALAERAQKAGRFAEEIVPVAVRTRKGEQAVDADEHPRHDSTPETLARLRPAFAKDGTVTAGNASGINDGAAALVLMSAAEAARRGLEPLARIVSSATAGVDPAIMGTGPIPASRKALARAGWAVDDAGAGGGQRGVRGAGAGGEPGDGLGPGDRERQRRRDRARPPDRRVGGAGAGDAAARDAPAWRQARLATLCIGGGMGIAMTLER